MIRKITLGFTLLLIASFVSAQTKDVVLVEVFTETGCGACADNDSAFQALKNANADKIGVISYHCYYTLDTFYAYNKVCDQRYDFYKIHNFPSAMVNGKEPSNGSTHLSYVNSPLINSEFKKERLFHFEISPDISVKGNAHSSQIKVKATSLKENKNELRLFVAITEDNINYEERYHSKAVNGQKSFNNILRKFLPDDKGYFIGPQEAGKVNKVKVSFVNDEKEMNFRELKVVVFVQDMTTKEILGAATLSNNLFR